MVVNLYTSFSDPKTVNKTLSQVATIDGVARDPVDVVNPVIEYEAENYATAAVNYAYIPEYNRYYFVDPQNDSYNMNTLTLHCDVLATAAAYLAARNATVTRNEKLYNSYLNDPEFKSYAYTNIVTKAFPSGVTGDSIILMTVG